LTSLTAFKTLLCIFDHQNQPYTATLPRPMEWVWGGVSCFWPMADRRRVMGCSE